MQVEQSIPQMSSDLAQLIQGLSPGPVLYQLLHRLESLNQLLFALAAQQRPTLSSAVRNNVVAMQTRKARKKGGAVRRFGLTT
jgi:hypothetical protein